MHTSAPTQQTGKSLISFIIGLLIATVIIAGILYYLNNSKSDFKASDTNPIQTPPQPEILTPNNASQSSLPPLPVASSPSIDQQVSTASQPDVAPTDEIQNNGHSQYHPPQQNGNKSIESQTNQKKNGTKPSESATGTSNHPVTPEQILSSGSIEKAQRDVQKKEQHSDHRIYLQIGSFDNRTDADAQRAKLVMLGINSNIVSAKVKGMTKYRVQTNNLSQQQASQIKQTLQQHNINSLTRTAS